VIIGLGTDLCDVRRIEETLERFGARFVERLFDESEQRAVERRPERRANGYALRFAAKEACAKALGTGFRQGVFWRDMIVANEPSGKPVMILKNGALEHMNALTPEGWIPIINVSLTDEPPTAQAVVVISAVAPEHAHLVPGAKPA